VCLHPKIYIHFHAKYKEFDECHRSIQQKIEGLEGKIRGLHTCILDLEAQIEDFKALDNEETWKLAKKEEMQALKASISQLKKELEVETRQWTKVHNRHMDSFSRV
jgi:predicted RNase H-like nuclease (RuvC/YqgF family)